MVDHLVEFDELADARGALIVGELTGQQAGFAAFGPVSWCAALPLAIGLLAGSWLGPVVARWLPAGLLRIGIALARLALAVRLGIDAW